MTKKVVAVSKADRMVNIGEITGAHGVKGQIKVASLTDFDNIRFAVGAKVYVEKLKTDMTIVQSSVHKGLRLLQLDGINDRDVAASLLHTYLQIDKKDLQELPKGEYYQFQLLGLEVYENDKLLGTISSVRQTGANDIYYIDTLNNEGQKGQILLPAIKSVVLSVDLENKKMQVNLPKGLLDL